MEKKRFLTGEICITKADGTLVTINPHRCDYRSRVTQHSNEVGELLDSPQQGGTRFNPAVSQDEINFLARAMLEKLNTPIYTAVSPKREAPAPDVGTSEEDFKKFEKEIARLQQ